MKLTSIKSNICEITFSDPIIIDTTNKSTIFHFLHSQNTSYNNLNY